MKFKTCIFSLCIISLIFIVGALYERSTDEVSNTTKQDAILVTAVATKQTHVSGVEPTIKRVANKVDFKSISPYIGMLEDDLRVCALGSPETVNTITTANGISKQFCYSGYKYVYVENGVVTKIQD